MIKSFRSLLLIFFSVWIFSACNDEDTFSTSKADWLTFSADTVSFDTVVSTVGSSTRVFRVFNNTSKGLRIKSVRLVDGATSGFRVNIDGTYLGPSSNYSTEDLELHGKDSLTVFTDVTPKMQNSDTPQLLSDKIEFVLESGLVQTVVLEAHAQDVNILKAHIITSDTTLTAERPFVIYDSLTIQKGATLTLQPGVQLYFHDKAGVIVHGTLLAQGTLEHPIVFRTDRTDRMFDYLPYDNVAGRWGGIHFSAESMNNKLNYCDIHGGSYGLICDETSELDSDKLVVENSVIQNIQGVGISLTNCRSFIANTQITNTLGHCVYIFGGSAQFVHCTIAQFYPWEGSSASALTFTNAVGDTIHPLLAADFQNCLVTGHADDEVFGQQAENKNIEFNYSFKNCFLNTTDASQDQNMVNIRYDLKTNARYQSTNFRSPFYTKSFLYNFSLDSLSTAVDAGDAALSARYPLDRLGVSRLSDKAPDAGCYEFVPKK